MGSPCPTSTYAISRPKTRRRCFWYGNAAETMFVSLPSFAEVFMGLHPFSIEGCNFCSRVIPEAELPCLRRRLCGRTFFRRPLDGQRKLVIARDQRGDAATLELAEQLSSKRRIGASSRWLLGDQRPSRSCRGCTRPRASPDTLVSGCLSC